MKHWSLILIFLFPWGILGANPHEGRFEDTENGHFLHQFIETSRETLGSEEMLYRFIDQFGTRSKLKNEKAFLSQLFYQTHKKFLKHYHATSSFSALFNAGQYNCLTATALYALLFDHFEINYQVVETNYHIFILAEVEGDSVLIESTDPLHGLVFDQQEIKKRKLEYQKNIPTLSEEGKSIFQYSVQLYRSITLKELLGLLYYNEAVNAYNLSLYVVSSKLLSKAYQFYHSERLDEFTKLFYLTLKVKVLSEDEKNQCLLELNSLGQPILSLN